MSLISKFVLFAASVILSLQILQGCKDRPSSDVTKKEVVETPQEISVKAEDIIKGTLEKILTNNPELPDSFRVKNAGILHEMYQHREFKPLWFSEGRFVQRTDSFLSLLDSCMLLGMFPSDYYHKRIHMLRLQLLTDTAREKKMDASQWAFADLMLSSAFVQLVKDVKIGRLLPDSIIAKDSTLTYEFFNSEWDVLGQVSNDSFTKRLEPHHRGYWDIRAALPNFLRKADLTNYTFVASKDSSELRSLIYKRLTEEDTSLVQQTPDSLAIVDAIKKYQERKKLKVDGKITSALLNLLNDTDLEKFVRIAINLDRFKQLQPLPSQHIWVNIPGFYLELREKDSLVLTSKVCVGKPVTKTPVITSAITDMVTYPKWTIPESIVKQEILPGLKKDPGYTIRKGYSLIDKDGNVVDPYTVTWSNYKNYIPYKVVQGSGDDNALGVLKFNFPNKHAVYLHDTNQRYLFSRTNRALSHGCVRVQAWYELSKYILRNDSIYSERAVPVDSLDAWLATKQKRSIPVRKPVPLFIRYFTCDARDGRVVFYDDIYAEDKKFREKIFANKTFL